MAKLVGHAIHPMLIVFPLGLFVTALIFGIIHFIWGAQPLPIASFWMIAAGVIGGLLAAVFGLADWLSVTRGTRARRVGMWHGLGNMVVVALFAVSWFLRRGDPSSPTVAAFVLVIVGGALGLVTSWLGGELVERLGVGIHAGANPNAPSSLASERTDRA